MIRAMENLAEELEDKMKENPVKSNKKTRKWKTGVNR